MQFPTWYFVMSGLILIAVGIGLLMVRRTSEEAGGRARLRILVYMWPAFVIVFGLLSLAVGLRIIPWPRWR